MAAQVWGRPFEDPIKVDGRKLVTSRDAGEYIAALPKKRKSTLRRNGKQLENDYRNQHDVECAQRNHGDIKDAG